MICYRLNRAHYSAKDPTGASLSGGRWNSPGKEVLYSSATLSLACLEILVHIGKSELVPMDYVFSQIAVPDSLFDRWCWSDTRMDQGRAAAIPQSEVLSREYGDAWVSRAPTKTDLDFFRLVPGFRKAGSNPALEVPSVVIPREMNYLLNPKHPDFNRLKWSDPEPFSMDPRLLKR